MLRIALTIMGTGLNVSLMYEPQFRFQIPDTLSRAELFSDSDVVSDAPELAFVSLDLPAPVASLGAVSPSEPAPLASPETAESSVFSQFTVVVPGLPPNVHPLVHAVVSAQLALSSSARTTFLKRDHASEKRLGTVQLLLLAGRLFVPKSAVAVHQAYLFAMHSRAHAHHLDMLSRLRDHVKVCWDSMASDAERYYKSCGRCQHVAAGSSPVSVGRMTQHLYGAPNDVVFLDFYGALSPCHMVAPWDPSCAPHTYLYIVTLVDAYSRFTVWLPSTHKSAEAAIAAFRHWCTFYNRPRVIRTDSDPAFFSKAFLSALADVGTEHDPVPPYTHHSMGLLERGHKPLGDYLRKLCGYAVSEWVRWMGTIISWRNSTINRDLGVSPYEAFFCRPPTFAYDRLGIQDVTPVTPNDFANLCECIDACVRTTAAVSSALVAAQFDSERAPPPRFSPGDTVLVYFPDRMCKGYPFFRGPFSVLSQSDSSGNYYSVRDLVQLNEYVVHVERMKQFDMSQTTLAEQAQRQLPSSDMGIVVAVDGHRLNAQLGVYEFCIRFYSGFRAWRLYSDVQNLDVVKQYIALHKINTRKQTPAQQFTSLTGQRPPTTPRPLPTRSLPTPAVPDASGGRVEVPGGGKKKKRAVW